MGDRFIGALRKENLSGSLPHQWEGRAGVSPWRRGAGQSRAVQAKAVLSPIFPQESVPVSSYQQAGIPGDVKRKIARLGINMLLKMVSSRQGGRSAGTRWNCVWEAGGGGPCSAEQMAAGWRGSALEIAQLTQTRLLLQLSVEHFLRVMRCVSARVGRETQAPPDLPTV